MTFAMNGSIFAFYDDIDYRPSEDMSLVAVEKRMDEARANGTLTKIELTKELNTFEDVDYRVPEDFGIEASEKRILEALEKTEEDLARVGGSFSRLIDESNTGKVVKAPYLRKIDLDNEFYNMGMMPMFTYNKTSSVCPYPSCISVMAHAITREIYQSGYCKSTETEIIYACLGCNWLMGLTLHYTYTHNGNCSNCTSGCSHSRTTIEQYSETLPTDYTIYDSRIVTYYIEKCLDCNWSFAQISCYNSRGGRLG